MGSPFPPESRGGVLLSGPVESELDWSVRNHRSSTPKGSGCANRPVSAACGPDLRGGPAPGRRGNPRGALRFGEIPFFSTPEPHPLRVGGPEGREPAINVKARSVKIEGNPQREAQSSENAVAGTVRFLNGLEFSRWGWNAAGSRRRSRAGGPKHRERLDLTPKRATGPGLGRGRRLTALPSRRRSQLVRESAMTTQPVPTAEARDAKDWERVRHARERRSGFPVGRYLQPPPMLFSRDGHNLFLGDVATH